MSQGSKILIYIASWFFSVVGIILGIVWMNDQDPEKKQVGKTALIVSLISLALGCIAVFALYFLMFIGMMASSGY